MALHSLQLFLRVQNARILCASYSQSLTSHKSIPLTRRLAVTRLKSDDTQPKPMKPLYRTKEAKQVRFYILEKYVKYLKQYEEYLERKVPGAVRIYRLFMDGVKLFYNDLKEFIRIVRILNVPGNNLTNLTLSQLELYHQMPKDMRKVAPVLLLSALPFAYYLIFPLAYYFPRQLLCKHFWNLQQRAEFGVFYLHKRLVHNKPVFRHLQVQLRGLRGRPQHKKWSNILGLIGSGVQPTVSQILECKELFEDEPYHLLYLSGNHIKHLLKMHELHLGFFKRSRLGERAIILQLMDRAILREGGLHQMPSDVLKNACYIRGLNPTNMRNEDMIKWLAQWIEVSNQIDKDSLSLLLHCPILLGYNQPSNWQLIYANKNK